MAGTLQTRAVVVSYDELAAIGIKTLELLDVPAADARRTVEALLYADLRGVESHGIQRLLMYVPRLRKNLINSRPNITVDKLGPALCLVNGDDALGPVVAARGMTEAIAIAKEGGLAFVGCRDSNHFGAAAPFAQMACDEKLIAMVATNAFPTMAAWGGSKNVVGNNPFAIGVPCEGDPAFMLDIALSVSSRGRIRAMGKAGERMPAGWAVDAKGQPTTDPLEALKGFVLPIGGHKGYGLALAIDMMAGVLTGAGFAGGVKSMLQQGDEPQHVGHFMMVIDPVRFMPWECFAARMKELRASMRAAPPLDPQRPIMIPGEPEARLEKQRRIEGIPMPEEVLELLKGLASGHYDYEVPNF
ncbi:MAG: Ldh family oxidoreductase [Cyanobacteria bacterium]|nr:Ldh family oxidoreductase [Cyanobacteriota bacterium]